MSTATTDAPAIPTDDDAAVCEDCAEILGGARVGGTDADDITLTVTTYGALGGTLTATLCEDCADDLRDSIVTTCEDCSDTLLSVDRVTLPGGQSLLVQGDRIALETTRNGIPATTETLYAAVGNGRCESCAENYYMCADCFEEVHSDDLASCGECERHLCESCYASDHQYCGADDDDDDDTATAGAMSVRVALARPGSPGNVVISTRAVGVEIETDDDGSRYDAESRFARAQSASGLAVLAGGHDEHCGYEWLTLPSRGAMLETTLETAWNVLSAAGYDVNDSCGAHHHLDMSQESDAACWRILSALVIAEPILYAMTRGRETNHYARPAGESYSRGPAEWLTYADNGTEYGGHYSAGQHSRFTAVNALAYGAHSTLEIRALDGTTNVARILHTIALTTGIADYAASVDAETLRGYIGAPVSLLYAAARAGFIRGRVLAVIVARYVDARGASARASKLRAERQAAIDAAERIARRIRTRERALLRDALERRNAAVNAACAVAEAATRAAEAAYDDASRQVARMAESARASHVDTLRVPTITYATTAGDALPDVF